MKKLFLVRHGETEHNVKELVSGQIETTLTEKGHEQAISTGKEIGERIGKVDLILCSPLTRAQVTAQHIAEQIDYPLDKIVTMVELQERSFGEMENKSSKEFMKEGNYRKFDSVPGAETVEKLQERAQKVFDEISRMPQDVILIVAHAAFGRAMRRVAAGLPHTHEYEVFNQIQNGEIVELV